MSTSSLFCSQAQPVCITLRMKYTLVVHFRISAPYLSTDTAHVLIANILFLSLNIVFKSNFNPLLYSLENVSFMSVFLILSISTIPRYLYLLSSISLIIYPFGSTRPFSFTTLPLFHTSTPYLLVPNCILVSSLKK